MNKIKILVLLLVFCFTAYAYGQFFSNDELEIIKYQDARVTDAKLLSLLDSRNNEIVEKTLIALGNIGDINKVQHISRFLLSGNSPEIRSAAAFALSLLSSDESRKILSEALQGEPSEEVLPAILEAIGFIGDNDNLTQVSNFSHTNEKVLTAKALSIARFARRGIKTSEGANTLINMFSPSGEEVNRMIAYAFFNYRNKPLLTPAKDILLQLTKSANYDTRMWAFYSLAYTADENDLQYYIDAYEKETSWQVKCNILNSFNVIYRFNNSISQNSSLADFLIQKGEGESVMLSTTALTALGNIFENTTSEIKANIKPRLEWFFIPGKAVDLESIGEAENTYAKIYKDDVKNDLIQMYKDEESYKLKTYTINAFKYFKPESYKDLRQLITDDVQNYVTKNKIQSGDFIAGKELNQIYRSFVQTLSELKFKANETDREIMRLIFSEFVSSKDPSIIDECFTSLNDSMYLAKRNELKIILNMDINDLQYPKDKEAMKLFIREMGEIKSTESIETLEKALNTYDYDIALETIKSLEKITGKKYTTTLKPVSFFNPDELNTLDNRRFVTLKTTQGDIKIELFPKTAPMTVLNFLRLAEKRFYDSTLYHRVVANFVIQGGDPLNSGWGGPEYTIRSEFFPLHFERGILGMASDGKDTEGSQYFIMHSPFYHLDRNYTIFGKVIDGMNVVDNIFTGDYLLSVEIK